MGVICSGVEVMVMVMSATTGLPAANASVRFSLGNESRSATTNSFGTATFTLSPYMLDFVNRGMRADIEVSGAGYISLSEERGIRPGLDFQAINIFPSPELSDGEHRVVLSWDTKTDLDIYALQMNEDSGNLVCKISDADEKGCAGVYLNFVSGAYGPETITWTDADMDDYSYMLYVNDASERGTVAGTRARITLYGETEVKKQVVDGDSGEPWWAIGTFEPSVGTSSWATYDTLLNSDPVSLVSRGAGAKDNKWFEAIDKKKKKNSSKKEEKEHK